VSTVRSIDAWSRIFCITGIGVCRRSRTVAVEWRTSWTSSAATSHEATPACCTEGSDVAVSLLFVVRRLAGRAATVDLQVVLDDARLRRRAAKANLRLRIGAPHVASSSGKSRSPGGRAAGTRSGAPLWTYRPITRVRVPVRRAVRAATRVLSADTRPVRDRGPVTSATRG
jgi:hypothetical protein